MLIEIPDTAQDEVVRQHMKTIITDYYEYHAKSEEEEYYVEAAWKILMMYMLPWELKEFRDVIEAEYGEK